MTRWCVGLISSAEKFYWSAHSTIGFRLNCAAQAVSCSHSHNGAWPFFQVPSRIALSAAHTLLSIVTTVRATFLSQSPSIEKLFCDVSNGSCNKLATQVGRWRRLQRTWPNHELKRHAIKNLNLTFFCLLCCSVPFSVVYIFLYCSSLLSVCASLSWAVWSDFSLYKPLHVAYSWHWRKHFILGPRVTLVHVRNWLHMWLMNLIYFMLLHVINAIVWWW